MTTFTKLKLSGSTDGKGILVSGSASGEAVTLHTAHATALDEIWLYAINSQAASVKTTLEWGETTDPNGHIEVTVPGESGLYLISPGLLLTNSLVATAFASASSIIVFHGFVNRII